MSNAAVIVAAGRGVRFGADRPKQFLTLGGKPVLLHSIELFEQVPEIDRVWLVLPLEMIPDFQRQTDLSGYRKVAAVIQGGVRRQDSVFAGLAAMPEETEIAAIHDAVRPLADPETVSAAIRKARETGGAILASPAVDTPKRCDAGGEIVETLPRSQIWLAQTPQVFRFDLIRRAYVRVISENIEVTDDASAVEQLGARVDVIASPRPNPKITTPDDLLFAEWLLEQRART